MKTTITALALTLALSVPAFALNEAQLDKVTADYSEAEGLKLIESAPSGDDGKLFRGIIYHNIANESKGKYVKEAENELIQIKDNDPLARAYYGSLLTVKGGVAADNKNLISAIKLLKSGFGEIDKAVTLAPADINIRFVRLINAIECSASSPVKRYKIAKEDIGFLHSKESSLSANNKALLAYWEGEYFLSQKEASQAIASFRKSMELAPQSDSAVKAKKRMADLND